MWNERYAEPGFAYGIKANDFLAAQAEYIPKGRVLCIAEGEGRNAVYLAKLGYEVHAVDLSEVGLEKAKRLANENGVTITTEIADLSTYSIAPSHWQGIISIFAHLPPAIRKKLNLNIVQGLAPEGVLILEAYTPRQLEIGGIGGPGKNQADMLMNVSELRKELSGLTLQVAQEVGREVNEGKFHQGLSAVVQIVAKK